MAGNAEIESFTDAEDQEILSFLRDNEIQIMPTISNEFARQPLTSILNDRELRDNHSLKIVALVKEKDYDGISLNYENLNPEDKDNYTLFIGELSEKLHAEDKILSINLHAKTESEGTWNGPQAQDWRALAEHADILKIMAYDYHWSTSVPGSIAPPSWVEDVVKFAVTEIPKEKIYLGIGLYGYDWMDITSNEAQGTG